MSYIGTSESGGRAMIGTGAPRDPGEVHVSLAGGFLAGWSFARLQGLAKWVRDHGGKFTRLDKAFDDRVGVATIAMVRRAIGKGQAVTRFKDMLSLNRLGLERKKEAKGETLNIGSRKSRSFLRVYDKAIEQRQKGVEVDGPWVRWELELKEERANVCGQALASLDEDEYRRFLIGVLRSAIDFRQTDWEAEPIERMRACPVRWWARLTEGFAKARLMVEATVKHIEDVKQWVSKSLAPMLAVIVKAPSAGQAWLEKVIKTGTDRWRPKHYALIQRPMPPMKEYVLNHV